MIRLVQEAVQHGFAQALNGGPLVVHLDDVRFERRGRVDVGCSGHGVVVVVVRDDRIVGVLFLVGLLLLVWVRDDAQELAELRKR